MQIKKREKEEGCALINQIAGETFAADSFVLSGGAERKKESGTLARSLIPDKMNIF